MSLTVLVAHTGAQIQVDPRSLTSLGSLQSWIASTSSIPVARQILMTGRGKPVKLQNLLTEREIFVYDRELLSARAPGHISSNSKRPSPSPYMPQQAPAAISSQSSLEAWQQLFQERELWAIQIAKASNTMLQQISTYAKESQVIKRATLVAAGNPKQHIDSLQSKYTNTESWIDGIVQEYGRLVPQSEKAVAASAQLSIDNALARIIVGSNVKATSGKGTLESMIAVPSLESAKRTSAKAVGDLRQKLQDVQGSYQSVVQNSVDLPEQVETRLSRMTQDVTEAVESCSTDIDICVRQISDDCTDVAQSNAAIRSTASISKTALLHEKKFLPALYDTAIAVVELHRGTIDNRNAIEDVAIQMLQHTASIESSLATVRANIQEINLTTADNAALDTLGHVAQYPSIYGLLLIEVVHRLEWNEKMLTDTSSLAEELASFKDHEEKRRKKWQKNVEELIIPDGLSYRARGVDISLTGQEEIWSQLTRDDALEYIQELENAGFDELVQELAESFKTLDIPSKTQPKRLNAFRNGAMNESGMGRNSLMPRGNDALLASLQDEKDKLENKLKSSESRNRKLEDILHKSHQMSQPFGGLPSSLPQAPPMLRNRSSGGVGHPSPRLNDTSSRRSSMASHRLSLNQALEEDGLQQKVLRLESDLTNERKRAALLEQSAAKQNETEDELRRQVNDAETIKKDLMENFQAQQKDFEAERKSLEDELKQHKIRMEELEEDYERVIGSHDNTRGAYGDLIKEHEDAIQAMRRDKQQEVQKANDKIRDLERMVKNHHNEVDLLKAETSEQAALIEKLQRELEDKNNDQIQQRTVLNGIHRTLDSEAEIPDDFSDLIYGLELLGQKANSHQESLRMAIATVKNENATLETRSAGIETELTKLQENLAQRERHLVATAESHKVSEARVKALEQELVQEREAATTLRSQVPGSELIKSQLESAEKRAEELHLQLATLQASNTHTANELAKHVKAFNALQTVHEKTNVRLDAHAARATRVSSMLFLQTNRLVRLLEDVGFAVSREEDAMVVQRVARTNSANQTTSEQASLPVPAVVANGMDGTPPESLQWANALDSQLEEQYFNEFIQDTKAFDLEVFSEAVLKRVKDTEHIARKWQREARTYRDRYRTAQFEAQHKIAVRAFKEGDLALFLPTRTPSTQKLWAAFNVNAPHYFLREGKHDLSKKEYVVARISKIEEKLVDMSKTINSRMGSNISEDGQSLEDDNPLGLSDGLRWYWLDAEEERTGAPIAPRPAMTTTASAQIDVVGNIDRKPNPEQGVAARVLTRSLDSRRSSANSKRSFTGAVASPQIAAAVADGDRTSLAVPDAASGPRTTSDEAISFSRPGSPLKSPPQSPSKNNKAWESLFSINVGSPSKKN